MNFSFLFILLLLVLGFTYKTLNISKIMLALIILLLIILAVSYNIKEYFQETTDENQNIVEDEEVKNSYLLVNDSIGEKINAFRTMNLDRDNTQNKNLRAEILTRLRQIK